MVELGEAANDLDALERGLRAGMGPEIAARGRRDRLPWRRRVFLARSHMLIYSAAITLYLAYLGIAGVSTGILLWPAVALHAILTTLLTRASTSDKKTKA